MSHFHELNAKLDDHFEFGSGGIARLGRKAKGLLKKQRRKLKETDRLTWQGKLKKGKDIVYGAKKTRARAAAKHGADRAEALARRKGRIISRSHAPNTNPRPGHKENFERHKKSRGIPTKRTPKPEIPPFKEFVDDAAAYRKFQNKYFPR